MTTLHPDGRRSLDGPTRRSALNKDSESVAVRPAPVNPLERPEPELEHTEEAAATEPIFVYHKAKPSKVKMFKAARWAALGVLVLVLGTGGWLGFKGLLAARNIIAKSHGIAPALAGTLNLTQLKGEGDGRVNILVLGIGGQGHEAPNLSDTIMVISVDPKTKDAAMLSIPRDLYVKIPATSHTGTQYG
ncbi:MAG TPA: LCP family protein, partial [Candidatus Saccharimonadia bacterium]|nr:LCP family protein [Candidatus Saccharimonadia bacterium]